MKITVITGSPHKNGTSARLAEEFIKGAESAGHKVFRFDGAFKNVHPCIACEKCHKVIRPQVCLVGEQVDNALITRAAEEVEKADVLLLVGCTMAQKLATTHLKYFGGSKVVLINTEEHYSDTRADIVIYGTISEILPKIIHGESEDSEKL